MLASLWEIARPWFDLSLRERWILVGIVLLFCVGVCVRCHHRRTVRPTPCEPPPKELLQ